ncbi:MAG: prolipoprotein diacylglyceryl transferase [Myxococcales bacterium]|nr:prolipoprotein diacylglyceryl transferase [Myxococcales bacterium]
MYPILFHVPYFGIPITTFGVMMVLGFLAAYWLTARRMSELGLDTELASSLLLWCMVGGVVGSKLYYAVDTVIRGENASVLAAFFSRGGMTWYGGFFGGLACGIAGCRVNGLRVLTFANAVAPGLAVGQALGRVGCFLVGDDYGRPTDVAWGLAFPEGSPPVDVPVHPTMLYEVAWLVPIAWLLWRRRDASPLLIGEYLMANGAGRAVIEHWRVNERVALGLSEAQWIGVALVVVGAAGWALARAGKVSEAA